MSTILDIRNFTATQRPAQEDLGQRLHEIVENQRLNALFQPILDIATAKVVGYEGLIRGPSDSPLHSPVTLFKAAREHNRVAEVEYLCRRIVLESFARLGGQGKVFLNISPDVLLQQDWKTGQTLKFIEEIGLQPQQVIIEITENAPTTDYQLLREAAHHYRNMGFEIAIDDLGEGFSGLRLWSELRPNYIKIDMHFIQGINLDPLKLQFVRSIQEIANKSGARVIAEGIETEAELIAVRDLGIAYGQGYHIARPNPKPELQLPTEISQVLIGSNFSGSQRYLSNHRATVEKLIKQVPPVDPDCHNDDVYAIFEKHPKLYSIPVVRSGLPLGIIARDTMIDRFARPFHRELYGRKPCEMMMDKSALIVDTATTIHALSDLILASEPHHLSMGFIITDDKGNYVGMGSGHDLLRLITKMQISAARYANPLTLLPGNVPINEHIDCLLQENLPFVACYFDLDHFKPFNDVYGYQKGDEIIQMSGRLLKEICDPDRDFLGHIGGDDFIILFQSADWERRCRTLLARFSENVPSFYNENDRMRGGIETEDRQGKRGFQPLVSFSIGSVLVEPATFSSHHEVSAAAAVAKKQAKKIPGNSLFVERRIPTQNHEQIMEPKFG
ncbi:diguanylate cyclase [Novimethylophilus kurashikiensis]|uniref:Diguanylate cyclase n=1 Tax=Novimethylophilus kurashikiensis TaxID=1825523 RepID=A0A2R5F453_9PROT|nr:GGDEF domain-containing protein [Novimethylophilus kurashikiensis]GBG13230.1 diguanylate cyclase [Novimethylophilus kurashikiensis]